MKRVLLALFVVLIGSGFGLVSPELERHLAKADASQRLPVHIVLKRQFDKGLLNSG